jgi:dsRNA-specific ribonuclease
MNNSILNLDSSIKPKDYDKRLKIFIRSLLSNLESNEKLLNQLIDSNLWEIAFTHETFNPNVGENYEILEKIGDAAMKLAFIEYLYERIEGIDESEISELQIFYLSKVEQSKLSNKLKLSDFVLIEIKKTIHTAEDILESFFGALFLTGNNIKPAYGYLLCFNMIVYLFDDIELLDDEKTNVAITQLKELLESIGIRKIDEEWNESTGIIKLGFTPEIFNELSKNGIKLGRDRFIVEGRGTTKRLARMNASEKFVVKLLEVMKTREWKEYYKMKNQTNEEFENTFKEAKNIAEKIGIKELKVKTSKTQEPYIQLIGRRESDDKLVNLGVMSGDRIRVMRIEILREFIKKYE